MYKGTSFTACTSCQAVTALCHRIRSCNCSINCNKKNKKYSLETSMESQRKNNSSNGSSNVSSANHRRGARPSVGYLLFQYQSELTRRHAEPTRLSRTKIHIIDGLVSRTIRHLKHCSVEELQACKRELVYKEQLRDELRSMRRRKHKGIVSSSTTSPTSPTSSSCHETSATSVTEADTKPKPAPTTPPKPRRMDLTNVSVYGPEIFV